MTHQKVIVAVAATSNTVSLPFRDERFFKFMKLADALDAKGEARPSRWRSTRAPRGWTG